MSVHEIVQMYKEAKDKNAQIEILADLNNCSKEDILSVLENEGLISGVKKTKAAEKPGERKTRKEKRTKRGAPQTLAFEGEEEDGRSVTELSERGKRPGAQPRMTWTEEAKEQVRSLLGEGLTVLEISERMGLDLSQVKNAIVRFKLREKKEGRTNNPSVGKADSSLYTKEPLESAEDKIEPLGVVSLIRDYAKCITSLPSADIRNYEKIVRTFAESIMEGADRILEEGAKYGA